MTHFHEVAEDADRFDRAAVVALLNDRLTDCRVVALRCRTARWNVRGPLCLANRRLFRQAERAVERCAHAMAARVFELGGLTRAEAAPDEEPPDAAPSSDMEQCRRAVAAALGWALRRTRVALDEAAEHGDVDSADLLTTVGRLQSRWSALLAAHAEVPRAECAPAPRAVEATIGPRRGPADEGDRDPARRRR